MQVNNTRRNDPKLCCETQQDSQNHVIKKHFEPENIGMV